MVAWKYALISHVEENIARLWAIFSSTLEITYIMEGNTRGNFFISAAKNYSMVFQTLSGQES